MLGKDDTTVALGDAILVVAVEFVLTTLVLFHRVEESVTVNDRAVDIDDDITVDDTAVVATAIDVTTCETTSQVCITTGNRALGRGA